MRRWLLLALLLATPVYANSPALCNETPRDRWDITPACSDYDLDESLIEAVEHDDPSAVSLAQQRYRDASLLPHDELRVYSKEAGATTVAVIGLGWQHDLDSLDAIEKTLLRLDEQQRRGLAFDLNAFDSDAADAVAMRYLPASAVADYQAAREGVHEFHR